MNLDLTPHEFLTEFMLEQIATQPLERRLFLYRALADDTKDKTLREACRERAREIDALLTGERQMILDFRARTRPAWPERS